MSNWQVIKRPDGESHVVPLNDLRAHFTTVGCWCYPTNDAGVFVHHAMDKREEFENGRKPT